MVRKTPTCRFSVKPKHHPSLGYIEQIRRAVTAQMPGVGIYSQAADITSQVLNFGLSAPIDVQIQGRDACGIVSDRLAARCRKCKTIPGAVDVRIPQVFDYPTLMVNIDAKQGDAIRNFGESGAAHSLLDSLASSAVVSPNNWLDWDNGVQYNVGGANPAARGLLDSREVLKTPVMPALPRATPPTLPRPTQLHSPTQFVSNIASFDHTVTPIGVTHDERAARDRS